MSNQNWRCAGEEIVFERDQLQVTLTEGNVRVSMDRRAPTYYSQYLSPTEAVEFATRVLLAAREQEQKNRLELLRLRHHIEAESKVK